MQKNVFKKLQKTSGAGRTDSGLDRSTGGPFQYDLLAAAPPFGQGSRAESLSRHSLLGSAMSIRFACSHAAYQTRATNGSPLPVGSVRPSIMFVRQSLAIGIADLEGEATWPTVLYSHL